MRFCKLDISQGSHTKWAKRVCELTMILEKVRGQVPLLHLRNQTLTYQIHPVLLWAAKQRQIQKTIQKVSMAYLPSAIKMTNEIVEC